MVNCPLLLTRTIITLMGTIIAKRRVKASGRGHTGPRQTEAFDGLPRVHPRKRCYGNCQLPLKREYPEAVDPMEIPVKFVCPVSPVYFPVPPLHWKSPSHLGWPWHCH